MSIRRALVMMLLAVLLAPRAGAAADRIEGRDYFVVAPVQATRVAPGKIEVLEVFSYGCPACNAFQPTMAQLARSLPGNAQLAYLPASFIPAEDWPMFQRAYFAAQALHRGRHQVEGGARPRSRHDALQGHGRAG